MILENNTNYYAEWFGYEDNNSVRFTNNKFIGNTIDEAIANSHRIMKEEKCKVFIIEERIERTIIMQRSLKDE